MPSPRSDKSVLFTQTGFAGFRESDAAGVLRAHETKDFGDVIVEMRTDAPYTIAQANKEDFPNGRERN